MNIKIFFKIAMLSLFCVSLSVNAQSDKKYQKTMEKVYKAKAKELKKQKWQISGTSLTLDAAIVKHLRTLQSNENSKELIANVSMCQSLTVPKGCKAAYQADYYWKQFGTIVELEN
jgi:hypothetical protein